MNENVVITFEADTKGLDEVNKKLTDIGNTQKKNADQFKKTQKEEADAYLKANGLIGTLEKNIKSLYEDRQKAFDQKAIKDFNVQIAEQERALRKLKDTGTETKKGFESFGSSLKDLAVAFGLAFSIEKVIEFCKASVEAFKEAEAASKALEFAVKNVNKEGDDAVIMLKELADKLSSKGNFSIFDNDDIVKAQTALATYGLTSKEIERLLPNLINAASVTGDLTGTVDKFVNAINGQTKGVKDLGVTFKDTGNRLENYNLLIEQTNKLNGLAADALGTAAGQAKAYDNAIGDLQESLGEKLAPMIGKLKLAFLEFADTVVSSFQTPAERTAEAEKKAGEKQLENFRSYSDERKKAAIELNNELIAEQKKNIDEIQASLDIGGDRISQSVRDDFENRLAISKEKLKAAEALAKQFDAVLNPKAGVQSTLGQETEEQKADREAKAKAARDKAAKEAKEARDKELAEAKKLSDEIVKLREKEQAAIDKIIENEIKSEIKAHEERVKLIEDEADRLQKQFEELQQQAIKKIELAAETERQINSITIDSIQNTAASLFEISSNLQRAQLDSTIDSLEQRREIELSNKELTEKQKKAINDKYDKEEAKLKNDLAKKEKDSAIAQALINGALAITKTYTEFGFTPVGIAAAIAQGVATLAQVAVIESQQLPKYATGKEYVDGEGTKTSDSILARLSRGERVVSADVNEDYYPALSAIHNRRVSPKLANHLLSNLPQMNVSEDLLLGAIRLGTKGVSMDYDKLARAFGSQLDGLDELGRIKETNNLLSLMINKLDSGSMDRRRI